MEIGACSSLDFHAGFLKSMNSIFLGISVSFWLKVDLAQPLFSQWFRFIRRLLITLTHRDLAGSIIGRNSSHRCHTAKKLLHSHSTRPGTLHQSHSFKVNGEKNSGQQSEEQQPCTQYKTFLASSLSNTSAIHINTSLLCFGASTLSHVCIL